MFFQRLLSRKRVRSLGDLGAKSAGHPPPATGTRPVGGDVTWWRFCCLNSGQNNMASSMSHPDFNVVCTTRSSIRYPQFDQKWVKWVLTTKDDVSLLDLGCYQHRPAIKVGSWPTTIQRKNCFLVMKWSFLKRSGFQLWRGSCGKRRDASVVRRSSRVQGFGWKVPPRIDGHGIISVRLHGCMAACVQLVSQCVKLLERFPTHLQLMWEVWCSDGSPEELETQYSGAHRCTDVQCNGSVRRCI